MTPLIALGTFGVVAARTCGRHICHTGRAGERRTLRQRRDDRRPDLGGRRHIRVLSSASTRSPR
jgi:hypothetical protein